MSRDDMMSRIRAHVATRPADTATLARAVRDMAEIEAYRALSALAACWRRKMPREARRRVLLSFGVDLLQGRERGEAMRAILKARGAEVVPAPTQPKPYDHGRAVMAMGAVVAKAEQQLNARLEELEAKERMRETLEEALRRTLAGPRKRQQRWMSSCAAARTIPGMPAPAFDHEPFPLVNRWPLRRCERHPKG